MIGLEHYLAVAAALFVIGIFGLFLNRKNVIILAIGLAILVCFFRNRGTIDVEDVNVMKG